MRIHTDGRVLGALGLLSGKQGVVKARRTTSNQGSLRICGGKSCRCALGKSE